MFRSKGKEVLQPSIKIKTNKLKFIPLLSVAGKIFKIPPQTLGSYKEMHFIIIMIKCIYRRLNLFDLLELRLIV